jgi:hypothetical protein
LDGTISLEQDVSNRAAAAGGVDPSRIDLAGIAKMIDPKFDPTVGGERNRFLTNYMIAGAGGQMAKAYNASMQHAAQYLDLMKAVTSNNAKAIGDFAKIPAIAAITNSWRTATGQWDVPAAEAMQHALVAEMSKAIKGAQGQVTIPDMAAGEHVLSTSHNLDQVKGVLGTWQHALQAQWDGQKGLASGHHVSDERMEEFISPRAREAARILSEGPAGKGTPSAAAPPANRPPLTTLLPLPGQQR